MLKILRDLFRYNREFAVGAVITGLIVGSGPAAVQAKQYFMDALELFYTAEDLSILLRELGFVDVRVDTVFHGMIGFHRATKAA